MEKNTGNGEFRCTVCHTTFESEQAQRRHLYDQGLLY